MVAIRRSSTRIAIEKKLIEVEARIAADRFEREMVCSELIGARAGRRAHSNFAKTRFEQGNHCSAVEAANRHRNTAPTAAHLANPVIPFRPAEDDEALENKLKERILAVEEEKEKLVHSKTAQLNAEAERKSPSLSTISQLVHDGLFN
ncbi:hypothetical protein PSHT_01735 [Puccinia striiformis]|uniref:Uncharacterized protein n=1 Tax=Puccinia striiformis TaxID=27350 RepID=A0A2S4WJV0_9BASI|nr:hypothetical protein PSHT_01735 [Puccinia striiformis]